MIAVGFARSLGLIALLAAHPAAAQEQSEEPKAVGDYNGNAFETASGMRISADGTFQWYISVGALDLRAKGTWTQDGDTVRFTSNPKPVPPEFVWAGFDETPDQPFLRIVNAANGEPFDYASVQVICANGTQLSDQVQLGIWSPGEDDNCDTPEKLRLTLDMYDVQSRPFSLTGPLKPAPGQTVRFEFRANDIGFVDFTEVSGTLTDDGITISGPLGEQKLRRIEPRPDD